MSASSQLFSSPRLMPDAGYDVDPGPVPFLSTLIIAGGSAKRAQDVLIAGRRFEIWSPNSKRLPFYPGIKAPGVDLEDLARSKKRYDGHLGPLDPTYHPQHYQPRRPYLPFVRRHSHRNPPERYPEFVSLFKSTEAWSSDPSSTQGGGRVPDAYIRRLAKRNKELIEAMLRLRDSLRSSMTVDLRLLWKRRPLYPTDFDIQDLRNETKFEEALDRITEMQRGMKYRDAWIRYAQLKEQGPIPAEDLKYSFVVDADEQYMGLWMSDEAHEDAALYLSRAGVACFFIHEYASDEARFHHRSLDEQPLPIMQEYSLVSSYEGPWRSAVRRSKLRALVLREDESVGRLRSLPSYVPTSGSLALSNRQGYREPSLRDETSLPPPRLLEELRLRPETPSLVPNMDGLDTDAPAVASIAQMRAHQERRVAEERKRTLAIKSVSSGIKEKGKQRETSSSLSSYRSTPEEPVLRTADDVEPGASALREKAALDLRAAITRLQSRATSSPSTSAAASTVPAVSQGQAVSERRQELYGDYSFELSEFWRIDRLPKGIATPEELLALLRSLAKRIPFAILQVLRTWRDGEAVYWIRFEDKDQALRVRGYLSGTREAETSGCDGPIVTEAIYRLALDEVRNPEERPLSPTASWNLPVALDGRFARDAPARLPVPHRAYQPEIYPLSQSSQPSTSHAATDKVEESHKSITPKESLISERSPPSSPTSSQLPKRSRLHSPPRRFIASRSTRAIRETVPVHSSRTAHRTLADRITPIAAPEEFNTQSRLKGSTSRQGHNRQRYHRKNIA